MWLKIQKKKKFYLRVGTRAKENSQMAPFFYGTVLSDGTGNLKTSFTPNAWKFTAKI